MEEKRELKRTPLYEEHKKLDAQFGEFAGWEMPLWYEGTQKEVMAVRTAAGLFDVSHMGRILVSGWDAQKFLQEMIAGNIMKLGRKQVLYTFLCNDNSGIIDDLMIFLTHRALYNTKPVMFLLITNASNAQKVLEHLEVHKDKRLDVKISDKTLDFAMLALQGPLAQNLLAKIGSWPESFVPKNRGAIVSRTEEFSLTVSRTGYTGEDGFEIIVPAGEVSRLWHKILEVGQGVVAPCGLGARDILRLEAGLPLYGQELNEDINPIEAGLERFIALRKKVDFVGKSALKHIKKQDPKKKLVGFEVLSGRIARQGYLIFKNGISIGRVTSGGLSPTLQKSIGMGYVASEFAFLGTEIEIEIRGQAHKARIVKLPFYQRNLS